MNFVKVSNVDESSDEDPTHLNQILTPESVDTAIETIKKLQKECAAGSINGSGTGSNSDSSYGKVSEVQEVSFNDENGYPTIGYMRCTMVVRRDIVDESQESSEEPPSKKKKGADEKDETANFMNSTLAGAMALQSLGKSISGQGSVEESVTPPSESVSSSMQPMKRPEGEDEFICTIRPGHMSVPNNFYLSKASMVEHDINNPGMKEDESLSSRDESGSGSGGNADSRTTGEKAGTSGSDTSTSTTNKNCTSSETGSEDNGNEEDSA